MRITHWLPNRECLAFSSYCLTPYSHKKSCSAGGVIIVGFHGKIDVDNTLEERLRLMESESLPAVRLTLFGPSPNRKFYD